MALISCPDCAQPVSSEAKACPQCGYPVAERLAQKAARAEAATADEILLEVRPSWWGFFWHLLFAWLIVPLLVALWQRKALLLQVHPDRVRLVRGILNRETREFFIKDIRSIDVDQSWFQTLCGIGDITISTAATQDASEVVTGVPDPTGIKDRLIRLRQQCTEADRSNTP